MSALLFFCGHAGMLLAAGPLLAVPAPTPPVSASVRIVSGPWGGREYAIARNTLTVFQIPPVQAANHALQQLFRVPLPADAARQRFSQLNPATYHGIPHELLDGGSVLVIDMQQGSLHQTVQYQGGQYTRLDPTTAFLLGYINQHVPAKLAIAPQWLKPAADKK